MVGGEGLGEEGAFAVVGVLEVDFEGGEGMADGGEFMQVCNIYPIGIFCHALCQYHGCPRITKRYSFQVVLAARKKFF